MKKTLIILLLLTLLINSVFAANQVFSSKRAQLLDGENAGAITLVKEQDYASQLGGVRAIEILDRPSLAIGEKDYPVTVGDVYSLTYTLSGVSIVLPLQVTHSGTVRVPNVGDFSTLNKSFIELKNEIEQGVTSNYPYSNPTLTLTKTGVFTVFVSGEVYSSRRVEAWGLTRLSDMIGYATNMASTRNVIVKNSDGETSYDLYKALKEGDSNSDPILKSGDTVIFTERERLITIGGSVMIPGSYQLEEGEDLNALINRYAGGFSKNADSSKIILKRFENGRYNESIIENIDNLTLLDGDIIYISAIQSELYSVSIEGALLNDQKSASVSGSASTSYYFRFSTGDTVRDLVEVMNPYFISESDLAGASLIRKGEIIPISFADVLYGNDEMGNMALESGDRFIIPFSQLIVNVIGAVNKSGVYGFVPGKTASYYITLAGGYSTDAKGQNDFTIRDKYGNKIKASEVVPAEAVIEVARDNFVKNLQPAVAVIGIVSSVLAIVTSTLAIVAPSIYW